MTVQQLRYFISVAEYKHFGEAARACYVSQPTLSHSIADLEVELGVRLFNRGNRYVNLTPAGEIFFSDAQDILSRLDNAIIRAKRASSGFSGTLKIGTLGGLAKGDLPSRISNFRKKYEHIDVTLMQSNIKTLNLLLLTDELDVALTRKIGLPHRSDEIMSATLYKDRFGIVLRKDHPLAEKKDLKPSDLSEEDFVFLDPTITPDVYNFTIQLCGLCGLAPNISHTAPTLEIACTLIKAGLGMGILPDCARAYNIGNLLSFIPIEGNDATSEIVLAWKKTTQNPILPLFLQEFDIDMYTDT